jgi:two-component system chemotaxis response regulator CheB
MKSIKVLVTDASPVYGKMFAAAVTGVHGGASVRREADGKRTLALVKRNAYDLIIIDAECIGDMLAEILREAGRAFTLVTARPSKAGEELLRGAARNGAAECMTKPIYDGYGENYALIEQKLNKIIGMLNETGEPPKTEPKIVPKPAVTVPSGDFRPDLILIASSTGGPRMLESLLPALPADFPVPILVVQHNNELFTNVLTQRIDKKSGLRIKTADDGEPVTKGTVYFAVGERHMKLGADGRLIIEDSPPIDGYLPSADVLFLSVAENFGGNVAVIILSGMGDDGCKGVAGLKAGAGCYCIAQSEESCVVYGMPRAVAECGLADAVMGLDGILGWLAGIKDG